MPVWVTGFVVTDVAVVHQKFKETIDRAERLVELERKAKVDTGGAAYLKGLKDAYATFNANLKLVAQQGAARAQKDMVGKLGNFSRPRTGSTPPLEHLVEAAPLAPIGDAQTGAVGVGNVELLNRAINPHSRGYGPYWRAIEYGTGAEGVPSQLGRILYGSFVESGLGNPTRPLSEFAGGGGPHPIFISKGVGSTQSDGVRVLGLGTIQHEVPAKHFIRDGKVGAEVEWRSSIARTQERAISELRALKLSGS